MKWPAPTRRRRRGDSTAVAAIPLTGVWERLVADATTAQRRLAELTSDPPRGEPGELGELLGRAGAAGVAAVEQVRHDAALGTAQSPETGLDVPHGADVRRLYDETAARVRRLRDLAYRASLLTVPTAEDEQRFLLSGLRRAVGDVESRLPPCAGQSGRPERTDGADGRSGLMPIEISDIPLSEGDQLPR